MDHRGAIADADDLSEERWRIETDGAGRRLDRWLADTTGISRSALQREIKNGGISVNGKPVRPSYVLSGGDRILRRPPPPPPGDELLPEDIPLRIVYRDEDLVVVDKQAGLVVYPAAGHPGGTLMNGLKARFPGLDGVTGAPLRPGVVHRLDKDTSGLLVVALTDRAYHDLQGQFSKRTVDRRYLALIEGSFREDEGRIESPIGRSPTNRKKMSSRAVQGKAAITFWHVLRRFRHASLVAYRLKTGRTHQIRVHSAEQGHPLLGDGTYGGRTRLGAFRFLRQMLHAETLGFRHPGTGEILAFNAPPPEDFARTVRYLESL